MDYEKKYKEALERLRAFHRDYDNISTLVDVKGELESIFPELRESEDEQTRKDLRDFILNRAGHLLDENTEHRFVAYLEKQKEKVAFTDNGTPRSLADEFADIKRDDHEAEVKQDYSGLTDLERAVHRGFLCAGVENVPVEIIKEAAQECLSHLPVEWSKEDKMHLDRIQMVLESWDRSHTLFAGLPSTIPDDIDWLKSLRPSWKPSEQEKQIQKGDRVKIHCRKDRQINTISIYDDKVGEVIDIWDAQSNPRGHIIVRLDNGCKNGFHDDELELLHWKPSEDQMKALLNAEGYLRDGDQFDSAKSIAKLYEQLKKL